MTQKERVLRALQAVGPRGLTAADFSGLHGTPDGGPPIMRVAARIMDLRQEGHVIVECGKRDACKVYRLEREAWTPVEPKPPAEPEQLFSATTIDAIRGEAA